MSNSHTVHRRSTVGPNATSPVVTAGKQYTWIPAALGLLVSLYLLITDLTNGSTLCLAGSDCDVVRHSIYSQVLGIPLTIVGVLFFTIALALTRLNRPWQPTALGLLAGAGLGGAIVLLALQLFTLRAICAYCVLTECAAIALAAVVLRGNAGGIRVRSIVASGAAALFLTLAYIQMPTVTGGASDAVALADHLKQSGAVFYGAYWCPHCQEQKTLFGSAASRLPYVECDPGGRNAEPARCAAVGVRAYPTWVINGEKLEGAQSLSELARRSGFTVVQGSAGPPEVSSTAGAGA